MNADPCGSGSTVLQKIMKTLFRLGPAPVVLAPGALRRTRDWADPPTFTQTQVRRYVRDWADPPPFTRTQARRDVRGQKKE